MTVLFLWLNMKKILLVYAPFCTPASPPYSITSLYSFLKHNYAGEVEVIDLNIEFHRIKFPKFFEYYKDKSRWGEYEDVTKEYQKITSSVYSENNKKVVEGKEPELLKEMLDKIHEKKPDIVAFSLVYSSQAFYVNALIKNLKGVETVIGGPSVNEKLSLIADKTLKSETELLMFATGENINSKGLNFDYITDFSVYDLSLYFTPEPVIPLKTSSGCYYKKCAFCFHHNNSVYHEYPIEIIKNNIIASGKKYFFLIDDMIPVRRLLLFSDAVKDLGIRWACQLKPTKEMTPEVLKELHHSGLVMIMWGVESGNDRVLTIINKGTNVNDIEKVLSDSHAVGIRNVVYIMFGFPTETKEEFLETIHLLTRNYFYIDLVSTTIFGLQKNTIAYLHPELFGIVDITTEERTVLDSKINYKTKSGLTNEEASKLRANYKKTIEKVNKFPKGMNFFREHMMF
jgi:anaerobic magnesium-protoporphyrin IX monomethyl ester cyclase